MILYLDETSKSTIRRLQEHDYEFNGKLIFDANGKINDIESRAGQEMAICNDYCVNFHTHPTNYTELYPDHPSAQDFKYIFNATCVQRSLIVHLIFTPKYIYIISFSCGIGILNYFLIYRRIDSIFNRLSESFDRSTEAFRVRYIEEMQNIGFDIKRHSYTSHIEIDTSKKPCFLIFKQVVIIFMFIIILA